MKLGDPIDFFEGAVLISFVFDRNEPEPGARKRRL